MNTKLYLPLSALFFSIIAVLHTLRLIFQVPVQIGDWTAPLWLSVGGCVVPGILSIVALKLWRELD